MANANISTYAIGLHLQTSDRYSLNNFYFLFVHYEFRKQLKHNSGCWSTVHFSSSLVVSSCTRELGENTENTGDSDNLVKNY